MKNNDPQLLRLIELVKTLFVVHGKVTLASGREADFYVSMRHATLHHGTAPLIGHVMIDLLEENGLPISEIDAVGELTMEADPVASVMLHAAVARGLDLDAFVVRRVAKSHGMKHRIGGPEVAGKRVVVLEDTSATEGSLLRVTSALEAAGAKVMAVAVIMNRDTRAQQRIEEAGYPYFAALHLADLGLSQDRGLHLRLNDTRIREQLAFSDHQDEKNGEK